MHRPDASVPLHPLPNPLPPCLHPPTSLFKRVAILDQARLAESPQKRYSPPPSHCQKPSYPRVSPRSDALLPSLQQPSLSLLPTNPLRRLRLCVFSCFVRFPLRVCCPLLHMKRARSSTGGAATGSPAGRTPVDPAPTGVHASAYACGKGRPPKSHGWDVQLRLPNGQFRDLDVAEQRLCT